MFPPASYGMIAWVCLVPFLVAVGLRQSPWAVAALSYGTGLVFLACNLIWILRLTTAGYIAMILYMALYYALAGLGIVWCRARLRLPLTLVVPIMWSGAEQMRSLTALAFPWFLLGHSQWQTLPVIQISDTFGVIGVSFVIAMVNGLIAELLLGPAKPRRSLLPCVVLTGAVAAVTVGYGMYRLGQQTLGDGPRVAVVQENFPNQIEPDPDRTIRSLVEAHMVISEQIADKADPDLIVWPETAILMPLNQMYLSAEAMARPGDIRVLGMRQPYTASQILQDDYLYDHARSHDTYLLVGAMGRREVPYKAKYNSAYLYNPDTGLTDIRYDKIHLVPFGEYVPFRHSWPALYRFLNYRMTPFGAQGMEYSLDPGRTMTRFSFRADSQKDQVYRFATPICYEGTMAGLCRRFVKPQDGRKQIDFLVNISNDGWFDHGAELPQHLSVYVFRAVENRVAVARSVNTGISALIDSNGRIMSTVQVDGRARGSDVRGAICDVLPIDSRVTLFSRYGQWFGMLCMVLLLICWMVIVGRRIHGRLSRKYKK